MLAAGSIPSTATGLVYIALFGLGSMLGMTMLTTVIAWPLNRLDRTLTWLHNGAKVCIGAFSVILGVVIVIEAGLPI